jgi:Hypothetical glycosyl hydrolase 6/Beta-galactosidase trimerisation domain
MEHTRRMFLKQAAAATAVTVGSAPWLPLMAERPSEKAPVFGYRNGNPDWYDRPMRWAQLAFVEDDPGNYDLQFWLDYFKRIHADGACLSAGGVVAFYPTKLPLHYRSHWLGSQDAFGDIAAGCRKLGMNVIARTDSHACHPDAYGAHPEWIAVDANGNKRRHPSDPNLWLTCALGPYNFEFMTSVHEEIMRMYMPDGIFTNRWAGNGMCYCDHCRKAFAAYSGGRALPTTQDPQDPSRRAYILWNQKVLFDLWRLWNQKLQAINPNASYIANAGGGALSSLDMKTIGALAPTLFADRQGRSGIAPPWTNGKNGKEYRSTMGSKAIGGIFSVGIEERYRWKDSVQSGDEIRLWVADGIAQDLRPWFTKFNAKLIDERWLPVVEEIYEWHHANEIYLRNVKSLARVGMVYSQQTAEFYGGEAARSKVEDPALGFYEALVEARIPFQMIHDGLLDAGDLEGFDTLILPNIAALSSQQCEQIEAFVERGGSIVATFETSLYDEWGVRRENFGLASLFGASFSGKVEGPMLNSYLEFERSAVSAFHPLLAGFDGVPRIINAAYQVNVTPNSGMAQQPIGIIPSYPDLPMEEVFQRSDKTSGPGVYLSQHGRGRVVYFPGDVDRTFWESLSVDQGRLLANAVRWAAPKPPLLEVRGKGIIDLSIWRQEHSLTVHLVNLSNPMMMKGPIREVLPLSEQEVHLRLEPSDKVKKVRLLIAGVDAVTRMQGAALVITVPSIGVHEVIACDLA